ncbi:hypothetical protein FJV41_06320 [Myxococcus llanfairpwllgwyngyllgogerychwyrndrobwllllantysiliogogogochensis]|uniref:Uncharacterized protein n=1 Tax=Myxococcus llanfairpwllgwyngyllgogerychwyrndrobwllllantysiliogogogochensis TaxID=2590453 RepID=A0A540X6Q7_9BACT|nr:MULTISPECIES: hypothetical protein [Myxococcus]NTX35977.1 hypothetical protein [Myxococcus sp. CA033]TQF16892.1 hypothetical protein FJV41_06320 [Myxococcus llanfairpwllgwyngyllgogerychwyrndrobwllllantysiliogogogochensis]
MPSTPFFGQSTIKPQTSAADLKFWWMPEVNGIGWGYRAYKVQVKSLDPRRFTFDLVAMVPGVPTLVGLEVDLFNASHVWPGAPSTAVNAQPGQFGYLLLTEEYLSSQQVSSLDAYSDGRGKWPFAADLSKRRREGASRGNEVMRSVSALLQVLSNEQEEG